MGRNYLSSWGPQGKLGLIGYKIALWGLLFVYFRARSPTTTAKISLNQPKIANFAPVRLVTSPYKKPSLKPKIVFWGGLFIIQI